MPNPNNYVDENLDIVGLRPSRIEIIDQDLINQGVLYTIFGASAKDNIEVNFYDLSGELTEVVRVYSTDPILSQAQVNQGSDQIQLVNIDMSEIVRRTTLSPGQYNITINFFNDEVGSADGNKLFISDISPSRTEIALEPVNVDTATLKEIYEFIVPSVNKEVAQALFDETIGAALQLDTSDVVDADYVLQQLDLLDGDGELSSTERIARAGLTQPVRNTITSAIPLIREYFLQRVAEFPEERIQEEEFYRMLSVSISDALAQLQQVGYVNPKINLV